LRWPTNASTRELRVSVGRYGDGQDGSGQSHAGVDEVDLGGLAVVDVGKPLMLEVGVIRSIERLGPIGP
jgi:hypothetical protein